MRFEILSYGKNYKRDWQLTTCPTSQVFFGLYIKCGRLSQGPALALGDVIPSLHSTKHLEIVSELRHCDYISSYDLVMSPYCILWALRRYNAVAMIPLTFSSSPLKLDDNLAMFHKTFTSNKNWVAPLLCCLFVSVKTLNHSILWWILLQQYSEKNNNLWKTFIFQYWHWYRKHENLWWFISLL